jgi:pSer/pThr/pTyr-binding forkhead associated (FHA) protein
MADVECARCGHRNPAAANFCSSCGAPLEHGAGQSHTTMTVAVPVDSPEEEVVVDLDELPAGVGMLVVTRGPNSGSKFALDTDVVNAGRHPDSDIFLDDITVSRRHAEVRRTRSGYVVRDVGSLNGTYVNQNRIEDDTPIENGDELQVGRFKLVFVAGTEA